MSNPPLSMPKSRSSVPSSATTSAQSSVRLENLHNFSNQRHTRSTASSTLSHSPMSAQIRYIEGDITAFPTCLQRLLQRYFHNVNDSEYLPCSSPLWQSVGTSTKTLFDVGQGKKAVWMIHRTGKTVHIGRFRYSDKRQVIVVQHQQLNNGQPCLIRAHSGNHGKGGVTKSQWVVWDPDGSQDDSVMIERLITPCAVADRDTNNIEDGNNPVPDHSALVTPTSAATEIASSSRTESISPEELSLDTQDQRSPLAYSTRTHPRKSLIVKLKYARRSQLSLSVSEGTGSTGIMQPVSTEDQRVQNVLDLTDALHPPLTTWNPTDFSVAMFNGNGGIFPAPMSDLDAQVLHPASSVRPIDHPSQYAGIRNSQQTVDVPNTGYPGMQITSHSDQIELPAISPPLAPSDCTTPTVERFNIAFEFVFRQNDQSPILRRRVYPKCKSVQMLYAQAVASGIATSETTLLFVQVADQNPRTVVKGDEDDFEDVKTAIQNIERESMQARCNRVVEVTVYPFVWSED